MGYREGKAAARPALPPIDPDAYLAWIWSTTAGAKGSPMTSAEFSVWCGVPYAVARKELVGMAALARRNARLALSPETLRWMVESGRNLIDYPPRVRDFLKWSVEEIE